MYPPTQQGENPTVSIPVPEAFRRVLVMRVNYRLVAVAAWSLVMERLLRPDFYRGFSASLVFFGGWFLILLAQWLFQLSKPWYYRVGKSSIGVIWRYGCGLTWIYRNVEWTRHNVISYERGEWQGLPMLKIIVEAKNSKHRPDYLLVYSHSASALVESEVIPLIEEGIAHRQQLWADILRA